MPDPTAAERQREEDLRLMLRGAGWQHVLTLVLEHLRYYETHLGPHHPDAMRFDALGRRSELLDVLTVVYKYADLPSPIQTHLLQFLGAVAAPEAPRAGSIPPVQPRPGPAPAFPERRRRQAGSVA